MNKETVLMRKVMCALSEYGCFVLRTNAGTFYDSRGNRVTIGFKGLSDLVGCTKNGRFFAVEIKLPGEKPREDQQKFIDAMKRTGAIAGCAHSVEEALKIVEDNT